MTEPLASLVPHGDNLEALAGLVAAARADLEAARSWGSTAIAYEHAALKAVQEAEEALGSAMERLIAGGAR